MNEKDFFPRSDAWLGPYRAAWERVCAVFLVLAFVGSGHAASIGVYADPNCTDCSLEVPTPPGIDSLYVRLSTEGLPWYTTQDHISVRFKLEVPDGWFVSSRLTANPEFVTGDPLGPEGVTLGFSGGHLAGNCIPLYTIVLGPIPSGTPGVVRVLPSNFSLAWCGGVLDCPYVYFEAFEIVCVCVDGGVLFVNTPGGCTIGVQPSTWTHVKRLFN